MQCVTSRRVASPRGVKLVPELGLTGRGKDGDVDTGIKKDSNKSTIWPK